jgi:hypothetical protein
MMIKRHTTSGEKIKDRKIGDAPSIGAVARTPSAKPRGRKLGSVRTTHKKKLPKQFFILSVLTCLIAMCLIVLMKIFLDKGL